MKAGPLLELVDVRVGYGAVEVLKGISLRVGSGEIVAILGANGAGKSTAMHTVAGALSIRAGSLLFAGESYTGEPAHAVVARGISLVPEGRRIFPRLTVRENLAMGAFLRPGPDAADRLEEMFSLFPILRERTSQPGGTLSGGEQQMLAIARGLMSRPRLLLLDEPSLGLAPLFVAKVAETLRAIRAQGTTVLLVEQNAQMALDLADQAYVLEVGRIALSGPGAVLRKDSRVQDAYLGG